MTKRTMNTILICLVFALAVGFIGWMTNGFQDWTKDNAKDHFTRKVNPDNLYTADVVTLESSNDGHGVAITVNDDGSIRIKGTASQQYVKVIGKVTLDKGEYTFTALENASLNTVYVTAVGGSVMTSADFTPNNTFTVSADDTEVTLTLYIEKGAVVDTIVYPVIVSGNESGDFYQ